ncbi:P27 family phage terminase small subunit [Terribacillus saccharophilus]|uniref:P27 family phage terminase small subunit n=1 Tax=Terribacillus saccharophilus TaxID=361277 RepID=UPI003981C9D0
MAKILRSTLRKRIEKDLTEQLQEKQIVGNHYADLVQDYLSLWDLKCDLVEEIEETGIQVSGMHGPKSNPSINDLHKTNDRMLKILDSLGLKAAAADDGNGKKNKRSSRKSLI